MISISVVVVLIMLLFGVVGYLRGWQREVIALSGLIASVALLQWFGVPIVDIVGRFTGMPDNCAIDPLIQCKQEFWIQAVLHAVMAFFSFQVVTRIAFQVVGSRAGDRLRATFEKQIIGAGVGLLNGYLLAGTMWGFLEYQLSAAGYQRLQQGLAGAGQCLQGYMFDLSVITRPLTACDPVVTSLADYLPMGIFSPTLWLLAFFIIFFVVIVALI
ncbi:MAG: CvpA family protein [Ardenticatenaceae bacterium]|nr:CvpA family protein [Anaerolineales bacterium]MCB8922314.1 CvpA family protein [Ardenticatenaceae bacterium]MCB8990502.1 CvpA family protein [Ardenticatenaceae bacterium]